MVDIIELRNECIVSLRLCFFAVGNDRGKNVISTEKHKQYLFHTRNKVHRTHHFDSKREAKIFCSTNDEKTKKKQK